MLEDAYYVKRLMSKIKIPDFPEEFIQDTEDGGVFNIIQGKELFMFRKDENTMLVIDGYSVPFDDPFVAKYYYFNSILANTEARFPTKEKIRQVVKKFERKLDADRNTVREDLSILDKEQRDSIIGDLSNIDRYFFLLFYDELMN